MAVVDVRNKEARAGLTFVSLSRPKPILALIIEPMPFDRLSRLGNSRVVLGRFGEEEEEVILRHLAEQTALQSATTVVVV